MNPFIDNLRSNLLSHESVMKVFIFGNESCDLDSAVSTIVYSFFLQWADNELGRKRYFIPFLNIPREDFPLKTEVVYFLNEMEVDLDALLFRDDLDINLCANCSNVQIMLIDHHIMDDILRPLANCVSMIFDHRPKDKEGFKQMGYPSNVHTKIMEVGSCATLIAEDILDSEYGFAFLHKHKEAAILLHGIICLDTSNFLESAGKAKELDAHIVLILESFMGYTKVRSKKAKIYKDLFEAKMDISSLSSLQLLSRDLKFVHRFPISVIPEPVERDDCVEAVLRFCMKHSCNTILIMGYEYREDIIYRDIAILSLGMVPIHQKIISALEKSDTPPLNLERIPTPLVNCDIFVIANTSASRKQVVPIINAVVS